jgi:hypothetical protein
MSKKLILEKYIKVAARKALKEQEEQLKKQEKSIYLIYRFPGLKEVMVDMMSPIFSRFISNVQIIAPKPTVFNIALTNGMDFYITYVGRGNFIAKIQGKKYNLNNLGEVERASQSISNMLELNYTPAEEKIPSPSPSGETQTQLPTSSTDQSLAADIAAAENIPAEETPEAEEETPPAEA